MREQRQHRLLEAYRRVSVGDVFTYLYMFGHDVQEGCLFSWAVNEKNNSFLIFDLPMAFLTYIVAHFDACASQEDIFENDIAVVLSSPTMLSLVLHAFVQSIPSETFLSTRTYAQMSDDHMLALLKNDKQAIRTDAMRAFSHPSQFFQVHTMQSVLIHAAVIFYQGIKKLKFKTLSRIQLSALAVSSPRWLPVVSTPFLEMMSSGPTEEGFVLTEAVCSDNVGNTALSSLKAFQTLESRHTALQYFKNYSKKNVCLWFISVYFSVY